MRLKLFLVITLTCMVLMHASPALARPGITGYSGKSGSTCSNCHSGGAAPTVAISGPTSASPGSVSNYTFTITGGAMTSSTAAGRGGACDIASSAGTLGAGSGDQLSSSEVVGGATVPSGTAVSFPFTWMAPATAGTYTLYAAGNSVNGNAGTSGDGVSATTLTVTVGGGSTSGTLSGLVIQGPGSAAGGSTATYTAQATYSNGSTKTVTPTWSVTPTTYASIGTNGVLATSTVSSNQTVTVGASYTEGGVTKTASANVTITAAGTSSLKPTSIEVRGPASVDGGSTGTYTVLASFNDGSSKNVTAAWSLGSTSYATISNGGVLAAKAVTAYQSVKVNAAYTLNGVTKTAFLDVVINGGAKPAIGSVGNSGVIVLASNDLGMHCVCPSFSKFMILPPYNTIRAQVIRKGGEDPQVLGASSGIRVAYSFTENTDASLGADPNYKDWMANAPKLGFKAYPVKDSNGHIQSPITGAKLSGNMTAKSPGWWEAVGIPVYPDASNLSTAKPMVDPLGGPNRNPYLTGNIKVYNNSNTLLAQTSVTVPTAFGGCCSCHLNVATQLGYPGTSQGSFEAMGFLHSANESGIDISQIDPDGDGVPGPIRCSQCHVDPAMGEKTAPGGYKLNGKTLPVSRYTFSDVLHRFHAQDGMVLAQYDPNIAKNCYQCHPGNGINCYRDHHTNKSMNGSTKLWCTDCHGDLNQRVAQKQLTNPWSVATLPKCTKCHTGTGENPTLGVFGGSFLNSATHGGPLLCSTCHGSPHALNPSTLGHDNLQNAALQGGDTRAIGICNVCHTGRSSTYGTPPHSRNLD